ncbi:MAG: LysM peptidoglycan-binding domain-containing protein [Clostridia bacterium]|nr:LysM peptidoglycan-binding domain-containing protein [Clostridia bacterium]
METLIYTVRKGDTLFQIAKNFGTTVNMIARYNGIPDPDVISEGQLLRIPVSDIPKCMDKYNRQATTDYIVKAGDSLFTIAQKYNASIESISELNNLESPDMIKEGQVLKIPLSCVSLKPADEMPDNNDGRLEYTVKSGDTLWQIAKKYGVSVAYLINLNRLTEPDCIYPDQIIVIRK